MSDNRDKKNIGNALQGIEDLKRKIVILNELAGIYADLARTRYDALVERGFTQEQTMQLIEAHGVYTLGPGDKDD